MTVKKPLGVSVIIPLFNKAATVSRAIESVISQGREPYEIIIVDDGSTDGGGDVVRHYRGNVRYVRQENQGPSAARNHGARLAHFPALTFLDADDEQLPGYMDAHRQCRLHYPQTEISICSFSTMTNDDRRVPTSIMSRPTSPYARQGNFYYVEGANATLITGIHLPSVCINAELFNQLGGFDQALRCWEVTDFMLKAVLSAKGVCLIDEDLITKYDDRGNSQFERTKTDSRYVSIIAHRILDRLEDVPSEQRRHLLGPAHACLRLLLKGGEINGYRILARRLSPYARDDASLRKLCFLARVPRPLLQLARRAL